VKNEVFSAFLTLFAVVCKSRKQLVGWRR